MFPVSLLANIRVHSYKHCWYLFSISDKIASVDVSVLNSCVSFAYIFAVTLQYKTGSDINEYNPTLYSWRFTRFLHLNSVVVNTTSPLLNYTFEAADRYQYQLWVSNAVSTVYTQEGFTGYCYYSLVLI